MTLENRSFRHSTSPPHIEQRSPLKGLKIEGSAPLKPPKTAGPEDVAANIRHSRKNSDAPHTPLQPDSSRAADGQAKQVSDKISNPSRDPKPGEETPATRIFAQENPQSTVKATPREQGVQKLKHEERQESQHQMTGSDATLRPIKSEHRFFRQRDGVPP